MKRLTMLGLMGLVVGSVTLGNIISPEWRDVRMSSEEVKMTLGRDKMEVRGTYHLKNTGKAISVTIAYPRTLYEKELVGFTATVDGQPVKVKSEKKIDIETIPLNCTSGYREWKVFETKFEAGQERTVEVSYAVESFMDTTYREPGVMYRYGYTLVTGQTWNGTIGKAVIDVTLTDVKPEELVLVTPEARPDEKGHIVWTFENFKPLEDIVIGFRDTPRIAAWLVEKSDLIVTGKVTAVRDYGNQSVIGGHRGYDVEVGKVLHGDLEGKTVSFRASTGFQPAYPNYREGEEVLLFLRKTRAKIEEKYLTVSLWPAGDVLCYQRDGVVQGALGKLTLADYERLLREAKKEKD